MTNLFSPHHQPTSLLLPLGSPPNMNITSRGPIFITLLVHYEGPPPPTPQAFHVGHNTKKNKNAQRMPKNAMACRVARACTDVGIEFRYVPLEIEIEIVHDFILMS